MPLRSQVEAIREFNRFYTKQIGVLREGLLGSSFSLTQVRVLYELAHRKDCTASATSPGDVHRIRTEEAGPSSGDSIDDAESRRKARQWSQWKSRQRWRQSEKGRRKRQQQSVRHRERLRVAERASMPPENGARGSSQAAAVKDFFPRPVIVPAATNASGEPGARHCSDSALMTAAAR